MPESRFAPFAPPTGLDAYLRRDPSAVRLSTPDGLHLTFFGIDGAYGVLAVDIDEAGTLCRLAMSRYLGRVVYEAG